MTAIEKYDGGLAQSVATFGNLSEQIARTEFVPDAFRNNAAAVLACMLFGAECGLGPMASLNLTQSIKGKVGLKPEGMRAVVQSRGHRIWPEEYTDTAVTLCGWRRDDPEDVVVRVRWTMEDAKRANLAGQDNWKKYPRAMLLARATSELCRLHFSDCTGGLAYESSELEEIAGPSPRPAARRADPEPFPEQPAAESKRARGARRPPNVTDDGEVMLERVAEARGAIVPLATDEDRADIGSRIEAIKRNHRSYVNHLISEWNARGINNLKAVERFSAVDAEKARGLLDEIETSIRAVTNADVVDGELVPLGDDAA